MATLYQQLGWDAGGEGWRRVGPVEVRKMGSGSWFAECRPCDCNTYGHDPAQAVHALAPLCRHLQATSLGAHKTDPAAALAEQGEQRREMGRESMERQS